MVSRLRIQRITCGLSQVEVERQTGIPQGRLSLIERGYRIPNEQEQEKLAHTLACTIDDISEPEWQMTTAVEALNSATPPATSQVLEPQAGSEL